MYDDDLIYVYKELYTHTFAYFMCVVAVVYVYEEAARIFSLIDKTVWCRRRHRALYYFILYTHTYAFARIIFIVLCTFNSLAQPNEHAHNLNNRYLFSVIYRRI